MSASARRARRHAVHPRLQAGPGDPTCRSRMARAITSPTTRRWRASKARAGSLSATATPTAASAATPTCNGSINDIAGIIQRARQRARHDAASGKPHRSHHGRDRRPACSRPGRTASLRRRPKSPDAGGAQPQGIELAAQRTEDHPRARRRARPEAGRIPAHSRADRPRADPHRARHLLGDVERALLLQVLEACICARCRPRRRG